MLTSWTCLINGCDWTDPLDIWVQRRQTHGILWILYIELNIVKYSFVDCRFVFVSPALSLEHAITCYSRVSLAQLVSNEKLHVAQRIVINV